MENAGVVGGNEVFRDRRDGELAGSSRVSEAISGPIERRAPQAVSVPAHELGRVAAAASGHARPEAAAGIRGADPRRRTRSCARAIRIDASRPGRRRASRPDRLKAYTKIIGLTVGEASRAFPLDALDRVRVVNEETRQASRSSSCTSRSPDTTTAFVARANGSRLTFDEANAAATELIDRETRSRWDAYGNCTSGKLKGTHSSRC